MIEAKIEYHPSKENYRLGDMESSIEFKGNRNFVANELKVFLDYMLKKEPQMTLSVIERIVCKDDKTLHMMIKLIEEEMMIQGENNG